MKPEGETLTRYVLLASELVGDQGNHHVKAARADLGIGRLKMKEKKNKGRREGCAMMKNTGWLSRRGS